MSVNHTVIERTRGSICGIRLDVLEKKASFLGINGSYYNIAITKHSVAANKEGDVQRMLAAISQSDLMKLMQQGALHQLALT